MSSPMYVGSIPAYAGDPVWRVVKRRRQTVYPRLRGGSAPMYCENHPTRGLSPPTRGIRLRPHCPIIHVGSIPAYAGDPRRPRAVAVA